MKKVSYWASQHLFWSRLLLILGFAILFGLGIYLGYLFFLEDVKLSDSSQTIVFLVLLIGIFSYPFTHHKHQFWKHSYYRQKVADWTILLAIFLLVMINTNHLLYDWIANDLGEEYQSMLIVDFPSADTDKDKKLNKKAERKRWKLERKKMVKQFKGQLKYLKKQRKAAKQDNTGVDLLFVLYISALIGVLILFIGLLVCALSCSGLGVAAAIVGLGGLGIALVLLVIGIRTKFGKGKR